MVISAAVHLEKDFEDEVASIPTIHSIRQSAFWRETDRTAVQHRLQTSNNSVNKLFHISLDCLAIDLA